RPPKRTPPPTVKDADWPRTAIDRFLLAALEAKGLRPVADADPRALIRRVTFDLTGLPPAPEEAAAFLKEWPAKPQAAFREAVDRLLASPRSGARWGRHWLDGGRDSGWRGRA